MKRRPNDPVPTSPPEEKSKVGISILIGFFMVASFAAGFFVRGGISTPGDKRAEECDIKNRVPNVMEGCLFSKGWWLNCCTDLPDPDSYISMFPHPPEDSAWWRKQPAKAIYEKADEQLNEVEAAWDLRKGEFNQMRQVMLCLERMYPGIVAETQRKVRTIRPEQEPSACDLFKWDPNR